MRVSGADPWLRGALEADWPHRPEAPRGEIDVRVGDPGGPAAYQALLQEVFDRIDDAFALHVAAVARDGAGILISGPSGFGKTTLALHLALAGLDFLCDDLALLGTSAGNLEPVVRGVHLRPGTRRLLSPAERRRARDACRVAGRGEWTVDPERWLGPAVRCSRLGLVLLLRPPSDLRRVRVLRTFGLRFTGRDEGRRERLRAIPGVRRVVEGSSRGRTWSVETDDPGPLMCWIGTHPEDLTGWTKTATRSPDFDRPPKVAPMGRLQAAIELAQEVVNRGTGSRLGAAYAGREAEVVVDLAGRLGDARCYGLVPGRLDATVNLVKRLVVSPRPPGRAAPR